MRETENLISHDNYVSSTNFSSFHMYILASIKLIIVMCTCSPQSIFFFPLLHAALHVVFIFCCYCLGLFLSFFLPIVLYVPYICYFSSTFIWCAIISLRVVGFRESEAKKCMRMEKRRRQKEAKKKDNSFMYGRLQLRFHCFDSS